MNAFKSELIGALAEAKNNPSTVLRKSETPIHGNLLAILGFSISLFSFILLGASRESAIGFIGLFLGLGAMFFSVLGLKTEGRNLATGGLVLSFLVVVFALINMLGSSNPSPGPTPVDRIKDGVNAFTDLVIDCINDLLTRK